MLQKMDRCKKFSALRMSFEVDVKQSFILKAILIIISVCVVVYGKTYTVWGVGVGGGVVYSQK